MSDSVEAQASLLTEKELWAQQMAGIVAEARGLDLGVAIAAARWACLWIDDYKELMEKEPPSSREEVKERLLAAYRTSLDRVGGIPRYPAGAPALRAIIAAQDVLCLAFGDEADDVRVLLSEQ